MSSDPSEPLFTSSDLFALVEEREKAQARIKEIDGQMRLLRGLVGEERFDALVGEKAAELAPPMRHRPGTLRKAILRELDKAPKGLTYSELRVALGEELEGYAPNTFFNTASSLVQSREAYKVGQTVLSAEAYKALTEDELGELKGDGVRVPATHAVFQVVNEADHALQAGEIKERAKKSHPHLNDSAIYAALSRLVVGQGKLRRDDTGRYYLN